VSSTESGGIAVFVGAVRSSPAVAANATKAVTKLEYEAHPTLAEEQLEKVARAAAAKWALNRVRAIHRTGVCELGAPTVVVACSAAHRGDALEACRFIIDEIKATAPIWKREIYADGSSWVGAESTGPGGS
jgi:molybdopterin synthase catalytic subunit